MSSSPKAAVAYTRVSTRRQAEGGIGLEGQWRAIRAFADHAGYEIVDRFSEARSGAGEGNLRNRPQLQEAIEVAKASGAPIIVSGLDRLSRHTRTIEELILESGVTVISATEGAMNNPITVSSRAARAQYERDMISHHTKRALAKKKDQGIRLGNPTNLPEAQKKGAARNQERSNRKAQEIARSMQDSPDWRSMTAQDVVDLLNRKTVRTSRGDEWTLDRIRRPLAKAKRLLASKEEQERSDALTKSYADNPLFGRF